MQLTRDQQHFADASDFVQRLLAGETFQFSRMSGEPQERLLNDVLDGLSIIDEQPRRTYE